MNNSSADRERRGEISSVEKRQKRRTPQPVEESTQSVEESTQPVEESTPQEITDGDAAPV